MADTEFVPDPAQREVLRCIERGYNVFFTGKAGTGKSRVIARAKELLIGKHVANVAPTGVAAALVGGTTINSFVGMGKLRPDDNGSQVVRRMNKKSKEEIEELDVLIIDEVSMMSGLMMDVVNDVFCIVRKNSRPFGGVQVVCTGDFYQLPPVNESERLAFESDAWARTFHGRDGSAVIELDTVHRQADARFVNFLNHVRQERPTPKMIVDFVMQSATNKADRELESTAMKIYPHRAPADRENSNALAKLRGESHKYLATEVGDVTALAVCQYPKILELKQGAEVMLLRNISTQDGLVNGARGRVIGFRTAGTPDRPGTAYPEVLFKIHRILGGRTAETEFRCLIDSHTWEVTNANRERTAALTQIPLTLAYASTIHKTQGMTINGVSVDLSRCFAPGQAYVALSRAVSLDRLIVHHIRPECFKVDARVLDFYRRLREGGFGLRSIALTTDAPCKRPREEENDAPVCLDITQEEEPEDCAPPAHKKQKTL